MRKLRDHFWQRMTRRYPQWLDGRRALDSIMSTAGEITREYGKEAS